MTLIDSNIIIYAAKPEYPNLRQFIIENVPAVSAVSYVKVLGYPRLSEEERRYFEAFFNMATSSQSPMPCSKKQCASGGSGRCLLAMSGGRHSLGPRIDAGHTQHQGLRWRRWAFLAQSLSRCKQ